MKKNRFLTVFFALALILSNVISVSASSTGSVGQAQKVLANTNMADAESTQTANLTATADTRIRSSQATTNYGSETTVTVSPSTNYPQGALLIWDLSSLPSAATITSASITLYVTDSSAYTFSLYQLIRTWGENTATWNTYNGINSWGTNGAAGTADRNSTNLWDTTAISSSGSQTRDLNSSGIAVVQGWIDGSITNYGMTMQNYSGQSSGTADYLIFASSENTSYATPTLNITYNIAATEPTITVNGTLFDFTTSPGVASAAQTYTVQGELLANDISISAPTGFELSTDGITYYSNLTLTQTGGIVDETTIYVRLHSGSVGTYSGNIEHTSSPADQVNLAVSGEVSNTVCSTTNLEASSDAYMSGYNTSNNYGASTTLKVATGSTDRGTLFQWDMSSIPSNATVSDASLSLYVSTSGSQTYNLYNMRRAWQEGTGDGSETGDGATWLTYDGSNNWGTSGAANTSSDRYDTNLWGAGTSSFSSTGSKTVSLDSDGIAVVQGWIGGSTPNYGLTMQNYTTSSSSDLQFASSENTSNAGPTLNITYCYSSGPTITTSGTLSAFSTTPGVPSTAQTYSVSGINLTNDISVSAPSGFQISLDDSTYSDSLTLPQSGGSVASTTIYVRLFSATEGDFSGNITHTSVGATTKNMAVSGTVGNTVTVNFQYGASGYTGTDDTFIRGTTAGDTNFSSETGLEWDDNSGTTTDEITLIRFDEIFSSDGGPIPDGATINSASLTYMTTDLSSGSTAEGDPANVYESLVEWLGSTATYNNFGGEAGVQTGEYNATLIDEALAEAISTQYTIDVTASLQRWSDGTANYGWIFLPTDDDGVTIYSSDHATVAYHPLLSVTYTMPSGPTIVTSGSLSAFSSSPGVPSAEQSYSVSGVYLTGDITINAPTDFQISKTSGSGFGSSLTLTQSGGSVASTPIYVRFNRATVGTSNGNIVHTSNSATTINIAVSGTASTVNHAPNQPVLIQPTDNTTGVSTPPTLEVTVSDSDSDTMDVSFYGREVGGGSGEDFMLVVIPDTQNEVQYYSSVYYNEMQWIANNKTANNIVFATSVGDIVNTASNATQWQTADTGYDYLDAGNVAYSVGPGNHDVSTGSLYENYFGISRFSEKSWYGGHYGSDNYNNYSLFSVGGMDFILINLQYSASSTVLEWADGLLTTYSDRRAIVEQHDILDIDNSWENQAAYTALRDHDNLFLMLCGHMHSGSDGSAYVEGTGTDGHVIHILLTDYQDYTSGGNGYLRTLTFTPADDEIYAQIYSPYINTYLTSESNYEQFTMDYDMAGSAAFEEIGTVNDVSSGSNASITWPGLENETEYEWYAEASDGALSATSSTWSFTTGAAVNHAPLITESDPRAVTMSEDGSPTAFSLTLHATDEDAGDTLTWSISTQATNGTATASGTGTSKAIGYNPVLNYNGSDSFVVQVSDGKGGTDTITVNVTIQAVNDAPVLGAIGNKSVNELVQLSFNATASDVDVPANTLTYSLANGTAGSVPTGAAIVAGTGAFTWTPTEAQGPGTYTFDVCVSDGTASDCETITITVNEVNVAPLLGAIGNKSVNELVQLSFNATASDVDVPANTLTYSLANGTAGSVPAGAAINGTSGAFTWTPTEAQGPGTYTFDVCVSDGTASDCETITVTVNEVNVTPVLAAIGAKSVDELSLLSFTASATDVDVPANGLTFSLADGTAGLVPAGAAIVAGTGAFTWTPTEAQGPGTYTFDACVSDGALSDCETITVTVNEVNIAPLLGEIGNKSVNELVQLSFNATASDVDVPANTLTYSLANGTAGLVPAGAAIVAGTGAFTWTPTEAQGPGTYTFDLCVSDGTASDCETITVTVNEVNVAPVLAAIGAKSVDELALLSFTASAIDVDLPANDLTFSLVDGASGSVPAGAAIDAGTGAFTWTPGEEQGGAEYTFDVCLSDGALSDCETITVTVNEINNAPVLAAIGNQSVNELVELTFDADATDSDQPAQALTYSLGNGTSGTVPSGAAINGASGSFSWTPTEAQGAGEYTFDVCVSDGVLSDCETITVTVNEVNNAPVLGVIGNKSVDELVELSFTATANDVDEPANSLTFSLVGAPSGASIDNISGAFNWAPTEAQGAGEYTFDVCVSDGIVSDCETIKVTVAEVNVAPELGVIGSKSVDELVEMSFTAIATDTDLPANDLAYSLVGAPSGALIDAETGEFSWTPSEAQGPGTYYLNVCVSDDDLGDCETIEVTVNEISNAPVANAQSVSTPEDTPKAITLTGSDSDGDPITFIVVDEPQHGTLSGASPNLTYTPDQGTYGDDSFTFKVNDGALDSALATVSISVTSVNDTPVAVDDLLGANAEDVPLVIDPAELTANDTDVDNLNSELIVIAVGNPVNGSVELDGGTITFTPDQDFFGTAGFDYTVSDGSLSDVGHVTIEFISVNDMPVITEGESTLVVMSQNGSPIAFNLTLHATDVDGDTLTWSIHTQAGNGAATASGTGASMVIGYTPLEDYTGDDSFVVQVEDGEGGIATIIVNVTINPVEDIYPYRVFLPVLIK